MSMTRRRKEMDVLVHQHIRVDRDAMRPRGVSEAIEIEPTIINAGKYRGAIVATLDDVQDGAGEIETRLARDGPSMRPRPEAGHQPKVGSETIFAANAKLEFVSDATLTYRESRL